MSNHPERISDLHLQVKKDGDFAKSAIDKLQKLPKTFRELSEWQGQAIEDSDSNTLSFIAGMAVVFTLMDPENKKHLQYLNVELITKSLDAIRASEQ